MFKALLLFGMAIWLSGCATLAWYGQAARGQIELLAKREDIADLIADPATPDDLRARLQYVLELRQFAVEELHLPDGRSYRSYADLEREAAVWNVVATPAFSMTPKTWCYPIAGCLAYRGYFRRERAEAHRDRLAADGYDAAVFPAVAYSTLGWFADPVLNTMLVDDDARLAGMIFHELAHEKLFVKGDTAFNEAYAGLVEREGVRRWLAARERKDDLTRYLEQREQERAFTRLLLDARERLVELYARDLEEERLIAAKAGVFAELRDEYAAFADEEGTDRFDA
ncbi:MAG: aminopeptidase, partial [Wenzhouxiangella sp.]